MFTIFTRIPEIECYQCKAYISLKRKKEISIYTLNLCFQTNTW